jgi:hypothetical protein
MRAGNKRRALTPHPLPSRTQVAGRRGCLATLVGLSIACVSLVIVGRSPWLLLLAIPGGFASYAAGRHSILIRRAWRWAERTGKAGVVITSDSPHWCQYIETHWLPVAGDRVSVLNWSRHREWTPTVETALFRVFAGAREYCPTIIVVRQRGEPLVFRFYRAFQARKRGNEVALRQLEADAFAALDKIRSNPAAGAGRRCRRSAP